jgi:NTE family protein
MQSLFNSYFSGLIYSNNIKAIISKSSIENICFKGGGIKGVAFIGVAKALKEIGLWNNIKRVIGSSAGAIFAGAVACKINPDDLVIAIEATDFSQFQDSNWGMMGEGYRLIEELGIYRGDYFYNWYSKLLEKFTGNANITLKEIYDKYGTEIVITTTNITKRKLVYLNYINNPNMKLVDAVRRSMSIPVFYIPISEIDENGVVNYYVDGGCTNNFPLDYFDNLYPNGDSFGKTIGFNLEPGSVPINPKEYINTSVKINSIIDLVTQLINTIIEEIERVRLKPEDEGRTIIINTNDIQATDFNIKKEQIDILIEKGYKSTLNYFKDL